MQMLCHCCSNCTRVKGDGRGNGRMTTSLFIWGSLCSSVKQPYPPAGQMPVSCRMPVVRPWPTHPQIFLSLFRSASLQLHTKETERIEPEQWDTRVTYPPSFSFSGFCVVHIYTRGEKWKDHSTHLGGLQKVRCHRQTFCVWMVP